MQREVCADGGLGRHLLARETLWAQVGGHAERHIKQKDLVAILGAGMDISIPACRLEGQLRLVQDFEIPILAEALGVSVAWLLDTEQE